MEIDYDLLAERIIEKQNQTKQPFTVICNRCGSHHVCVTAWEYYDLSIQCKDCGASECCGAYET